MRLSWSCPCPSVISIGLLIGCAILLASIASWASTSPQQPSAVALTIRSEKQAGQRRGPIMMTKSHVEPKVSPLQMPETVQTTQHDDAEFSGVRCTETPTAIFPGHTQSEDGEMLTALSPLQTQHDDGEKSTVCCTGTPTATSQVQAQNNPNSVETVCEELVQFFPQHGFVPIPPDDNSVPPDDHVNEDTVEDKIKTLPFNAKIENTLDSDHELAPTRAAQLEAKCKRSIEKEAAPPCLLQLHDFVAENGNSQELKNSFMSAPIKFGLALAFAAGIIVALPVASPTEPLCLRSRL
uniref:Uncharacterized protein n=1 Tax=Spongospora subterranea TaxID=70186 RepID=A0A0H5RA83_9EUKA|eukprot:CRZ10706.1 hypothetical protein [Spongospora subterranea]